MGVVDDVRKVTQDMILPEFRALVVRVENLEKQIAELRGDVKEQIGQLRGDVKGQIDGVRGEMKAQIAELQGDVKEQIAELRGDVKDSIADLRSDTTRQNENLRADFQAAVGRIVEALQVNQPLEWLESQVRKQLPGKEQ